MSLIGGNPKEENEERGSEVKDEPKQADQRHLREIARHGTIL